MSCKHSWTAETRDRLIKKGEPDGLTTMDERVKGNHPKRYRPNIGTAIHYLLWSLFILMLWPVAALLRGLEKLRRNV